MTSLSLIALAMVAMGAPPNGHVIYQERIIVRVPLRSTRPPATPFHWKEKKSRSCIPSSSLAGAIVRGPDLIDLVMTGGERWRVKLRGRCPELGFYRGFYLRPREEGKICAKQDSIHLRSGGECDIATFKQLVPVPEERMRP